LEIARLEHPDQDGTDAPNPKSSKTMQALYWALNDVVAFEQAVLADGKNYASRAKLVLLRKRGPGDVLRPTSIG